MIYFYKRTESVGGIYYCFLAFGLLQEKIFTKNYSNLPNGPKFQFAFSLVFFMALFSYIISTLIHAFLIKDQLYMKQLDQAKFGLFNSISMLSSNIALTLVAFPIQALVKSSKILSVMLVSFIFGGKKHDLLQYLNACLVSVGIFIFNYFGSNEQGTAANSIFGLLLLLLSLITDGLLADKQHTLFQYYNHTNQRFNQFALMKYTTKYTFFFCLVYGIMMLQIEDFVIFIYKYPAIINDITMLAVMGAIGQISIYYTISCFGPIILSFITTSRKFLTVILSLIIYKHETNSLQMLAIFFVFNGIALEAVQNIRKHMKKKKCQKDANEMSQKQPLKSI